MDEVGRGTSTYDGLAIAWAITEFIDDSIGAKTLFATHYHQMNKISDKRKRVKNFNILVKENEEDIVFLRKIVEGGTDKSYGIHVAKIAGIPSKAIAKAKTIQRTLEEQELLTQSIHGVKYEQSEEESSDSDMPQKISHFPRSKEKKQREDRIHKDKKTTDVGQMSLMDVF
jgi:DNA mismatch repair protein MutS